MPGRGVRTVVPGIHRGDGFGSRAAVGIGASSLAARWVASALRALKVLVFFNILVRIRGPFLVESLSARFSDLAGGIGNFRTYFRHFLNGRRRLANGRAHPSWYFNCENPGKETLHLPSLFPILAGFAAVFRGCGVRFQK